MNKEIHKIHHELLRIESQAAFLSNTLEALGDAEAKGDYDPKNPFGFAYPKNHCVFEGAAEVAESIMRRIHAVRQDLESLPIQKKLPQTEDQTGQV
jgi:hypothetical protein